MYVCHITIYIEKSLYIEESCELIPQNKTKEDNNMAENAVDPPKKHPEKSVPDSYTRRTRALLQIWLVETPDFSPRAGGFYGMAGKLPGRWIALRPLREHLFHP